MPVLARPLYQDPFAPVLFSSPALTLSAEQLMFIREVLSISSSDEQFADKAFRAIVRILTAGNDPLPIITSLNPSTVVLGSPVFDIHVVGSGFTPDSIIIFNGYEEPTTFVSPTELTTGVNMPLWQAPAVVPVTVQNLGNVVATPLDFSFTEVTTQSASITPKHSHTVTKTLVDEMKESMSHKTEVKK